MKYCNKRIHTYINFNKVETTIHYVTIEDVVSVHGQQFTNKWLEFFKNTPTFNIEDKQVYYYDDYKFIAMRTAQYLDLILT